MSDVFEERAARAAEETATLETVFRDTDFTNRGGVFVWDDEDIYVVGATGRAYSEIEYKGFTLMLTIEGVRLGLFGSVKHLSLKKAMAVIDIIDSDEDS